MRVMILDDDPWISDLLKQLVLSIRPVAQVDCFIDVASALNAWQPSTYQLVMADWNLPDALTRLGGLTSVNLAISQALRQTNTQLDEEALSHAVRDFAAPFAVRLKARWGLPMVLRELIGAIYALPPMQVRREQVVMRLAAAMNNGEPDADVERLQRLAGLA
ncbi:response regulator [Pseudomonas frederiksbergensis]|uniref:response regulator n=1 Tax=Pseudomonas frederiksbergensis TaxID=104087 RepID=UPI000F487714|nr:response regulator [Pseudomonas frederiksbergensis]RON52227.1 hypothetical protein BK667_16370 [Pseudomonas frederiksbergensis]